MVVLKINNNHMVGEAMVSHRTNNKMVMVNRKICPLQDLEVLDINQQAIIKAHHPLTNHTADMGVP